ncbi:MAG: hypothetical protein GQ469_02110 [Methanosarcinales archaeon]|nr:hypothetical protein [Methanosarcinales archaeon]
MRQIRIILGGIISIILYFGWILFLTAVSFTFFSEKAVIFGNEVVKSTITINPIFNWLMAGLFLVFFFASQYILCNNSTEHNEKINYLRDMKITLTPIFVSRLCSTKKSTIFTPKSICQ